MNINPLSEIFIKNIVFRVGNKKLSLVNANDVLYAVKNAYRAMQPRTFDKKKDDAQINESLKENLLMHIANEFVSYFKLAIKTNVHDFNIWHENLCVNIIAKLENLLKISNYDTSGATYGKVQKIVNVTFKNLYLFDDANAYNDYFKFCHLIIDGANLEWYNSFATNTVNIAWSNLSDTEYKKIQDEIRKYLLTQTTYPQNPFEAEFYIWADYQF